MGWVFNATPWPLYPQERPSVHCLGGWVGPRAGLDKCGKISSPPGFDTQNTKPVESLYTDWAIPAHASNTVTHLMLLRLFAVDTQKETVSLGKYIQASRRISALLKHLVIFTQNQRAPFYKSLILINLLLQTYSAVHIGFLYIQFWVPFPMGLYRSIHFLF
jgi:hypothetical protein